MISGAGLGKTMIAVALLRAAICITKLVPEMNPLELTCAHQQRGSLSYPQTPLCNAATFWRVMNATNRIKQQEAAARSRYNALQDMLHLGSQPTYHWHLAMQGKQ